MLYLIVFLGAGIGGALRHGVNVGASAAVRFRLSFRHVDRQHRRLVR